MLFQIAPQWWRQNMEHISKPQRTSQKSHLSAPWPSHKGERAKAKRAVAFWNGDLSWIYAGVWGSWIHKINSLCEENPLVIGGFPSQRDSDAECFSMPCRHHDSILNFQSSEQYGESIATWYLYTVYWNLHILIISHDEGCRVGLSDRPWRYVGRW